MEALTSQALPAVLNKLESMSLDHNSMAQTLSNQTEQLKKTVEDQSKLHKGINDLASFTTSRLNDVQATSQSTHTAVVSLKQNWARVFEA